MNNEINPKVTVLMSVYNGEKYLREAIDSILSQTFKDFEFIIINDGSTDSSREIILSYDDSRSRLIDNETFMSQRDTKDNENNPPLPPFNKGGLGGFSSEKNMGLTKSLNKGLKIAKGEYIARQDADDISLPERLEKQVKFLDTNKDVGLVGSSCILIDEKGNEVRLHKVETKNTEIKKGLWKANQFCHGSVMFKRECFKKVGFYREEFRSAQDYDLWFRISELWDVANIEEPLYYLRVNLQSISVVNKFEQERYASLVRMLAEQRNESGEDKLEDLKKEKIKNVLDTILPKNRHNEKKVLADGYFYWADLFYFTGNYAEAKKWLMKSLENKFFNSRSLILFLKIIICLKLSPKIIKDLKLIRERFSYLSGKNRE